MEYQRIQMASQPHMPGNAGALRSHRIALSDWLLPVVRVRDMLVTNYAWHTAMPCDKPWRIEMRLQCMETWVVKGKWWEHGFFYLSVELSGL